MESPASPSRLGRPEPAGRRSGIRPDEAGAELWRRPGTPAGSAEHLRWRNTLVELHLPLARSLVSRSPARQQIAYDDLLQVASLALIRAVECFDPARGPTFSSFAVPSIRGALLHELRDRRPVVRIPRSLWDLRQRMRQLQESRRLRGLAPLGREALAASLDCSAAQLLEIEGLQDATAPRSLDAPRSGEPEAPPLVEAIPDPRTLIGTQAAAASEEGLCSGQAAELNGEDAWLRERLSRLDSQRRQLLEGRLRLGMTWVELGRQLGIHPRMAQRRCLACLGELREEAAQWAQTRAR